MRLAVGCDHGGLALKDAIRDHVAGLGHEVTDIGTHSEESIDYPDFGRIVAEMVVGGEVDLGVIVCGTGIGISIAANKVKGARAALCLNGYMASMARRHNDANMLALGGRTTGEGLALDIVNVFLSAEFEGGRHQRRIDKIHAIEND
jgi:ribose 5-phosphate isomerase B